MSQQNVHYPGGWKGVLYKRDGGGCSSKILKITPKRQRDPDFCAWLEVFRTLSGTNLKTKHYLLSNSLRLSYYKSFRRGPFKVEQPKRY